MCSSTCQRRLLSESMWAAHLKVWGWLQHVFLPLWGRLVGGILWRYVYCNSSCTIRAQRCDWSIRSMSLIEILKTKTRRDKTRQDKTIQKRQEKTRVYRRNQEKRRQEMTRQDKSRTRQEHAKDKDKDNTTSILSPVSLAWPNSRPLSRPLIKQKDFFFKNSSV